VRHDDVVLRRMGIVVGGVGLLAWGLAACRAESGSTAPQSSGPPTAAPVPSDNPFRTGRTLVIPHAGGDGLFPENTLFAYERSTELGGDVVDVDVFLTGDGVPVAFHDATLERTTNGRGRVADHTAAELAALDAGWAFERDGEHPYRGQGIGVPTIEDVLRAFPTTPITLDLKDQRLAVVAPVCELILRLDRARDIYVGIDTDEQVMAFRGQCPDVRTSGTSAERRVARAAREAGDETFVTDQLVSQPRYRDDDGSIRITAEFLAFAHRNDTAVLTYVVDDPDDMRLLIELGVDGIYTRRPDVMLDVIAELDRR
jgi:glycerophosphoryl diester phosphodiesterase